MTTYALVSPSNVIDRRATNIDPSVETKSGWRWLPIVVTNPGYDPVAQVKEGPVITVRQSDVTEVWTVRDKTSAELDADKDSHISGLDMVIFKVLFNHENRVRALEAKASLTVAQFKAGIKALL